MSERNIVTVHVRYRLLFRHLRRYLVVWSCTVFALSLAVSVAARLTHSSRAEPAGQASVASSLLFLLGPVLTISYIFWVVRRIGYYAGPGELGTVGVVGRLTPFRQPTVRFHRFTMTNARWVRFLGLGSLLSLPVTMAVNETGSRSLMLTPMIYPQADIDSFLAASGLPVEGDWSERVGRFSVRKRWPESKDSRRQGWITLAVILPPALLLTGGFWAAAILLH